MIQEGSENDISDISPTAFSIVKLVTSKLKSQFLIERFIKKTNLYWDQIHEKDLTYFKDAGLNFLSVADSSEKLKLDEEDKGVLSGLKVDHLNSLSKILEGEYKDENGNFVKLFDDDRIDDVWKIMHSFVKQSIMYIYDKRKIVDNVPTVEYYSDINLMEHATKWNIKKIMDTK